MNTSEAAANWGDNPILFLAVVPEIRFPVVCEKRPNKYLFFLVLPFLYGHRDALFDYALQNVLPYLPPSFRPSAHRARFRCERESIGRANIARFHYALGVLLARAGDTQRWLIFTYRLIFLKVFNTAFFCFVGCLEAVKIGKIKY